jgi:hypothetical protein
VNTWVARAVFLVGCLGAAFYLVEQPEAVRWVPFGVAVGVALLGVVWMRLAPAASRAGAEARHAEIAPALEAVVAWSAAPTVDAELSRRIDRDVRPHLRRVEDGLAALHDRVGAQRYAGFMDAYARGERALNRAWSASADGYLEEARSQLEIAHAALDRASSLLA